MMTVKIIIDADACPTKEETIALAKQYGLEVVLVASIAHFSTREVPDHVRQLWVERGSDQADFKIVAIAQPNDIVITQDYGLASMLLPKGCRVLHHDGYEYTDSIIQQLIDGRHLSAKERRTSKRSRRVKSLHPFADQTQKDYVDLLETVIEEIQNQRKD
ncbi:YaiI/YqxD family protein [Alkalibacterium putridalgicola]|uniref:YaiI/YqxD family protein n=1 Tax=Alkalibacterium putridalgicola TaxID=426703 RepID=UPI0034CD061C